ncbi:MAG: hypothetical protein K9G48_09650 [Reyranella sp.]|nr:hypothetical protein [Reyranella sp.]
MVGALPALFGKLFLIGYLIPAAAIFLAGAGVLDFYAHSGIYDVAKVVVASTDEKLLVIWIGIFVVVVWVFAVLLMASNYAIIRLLEGYGFNPAWLIKWRTVLMFNRLCKKRDAFLEERKKGKPSEKNLAKELEVVEQLGNEFPESRDLVLPTRFGNVIRAFERYPQVIYGIESIQAWARLQALLSTSYCTLLDDAKAQLDLLVNLWFGGVLIAILNIGLLVWSSWHLEPALWVSNVSAPAWIILGAAIAVAFVAARWARSAAAQWGELVKGAFDLYRGDLARQMGLEIPRSVAHERQMWTAVAQTMLYRLPHFADRLTHFRPLDPLCEKTDGRKK